jgi:hypothetical protein
MYEDLVPLGEEILQSSSLSIQPIVRTKRGDTIALKAITVPGKSRIGYR